MSRTRRRASLTTVIPLVAALAACGGPSPTGSSGTTSPQPSATESGKPPAPSGSETTGHPVGTLTMVVADELRMRDAPGTGAELVAGLERGDVVEIVSGPVDADEFRWYEARDIAGNQGWLADGDGSDAWLSTLPGWGEGDPLLSFEYGCDVTGPFQGPSTLIFGDGRVLHNVGGAGEWRIRTLAADGLARVQSDLLGSPHLQASAEYRPVGRADAGEPPGHGLCLFTFTIANEGEPIEVTSVSWFGDAEEAEFYEPSPERKALDAIARNLMDINSVLGEASWEPAGWLPLIPNEYLLGIGPGQGPPPDEIVVVEPEALGLGDLETFGEPSGGGRCGVIAREQAFALARALNTAGAEPNVPLTASVSMAFQTDDGWAYVSLYPLVPGSPACEAVGF